MFVLLKSMEHKLGWLSKNTDPPTHPEGYAQSGCFLFGFDFPPACFLSSSICGWSNSLHQWDKTLPPCAPAHGGTTTARPLYLTNSWPPLHRSGLGTLHVGARFVKSALWIALPPSKKKHTHITWCKKTIQNCYSTVLPLDISMHKTSQQGSFFTVSKACSRLPSFERLEIMIGQAQFGIMWCSQKLLFLCVCVCLSFGKSEPGVDRFARILNTCKLKISTCVTCILCAWN